MKKANTHTYFTYCDSKFAWTCGDKFETAEEASTACIESMKEEHSKGFKVQDRVIVRIDWIRIFDELIVISEQCTKTTVEIINKNCAEEGDKNDI